MNTPLNCRSCEMTHVAWYVGTQKTRRTYSYPYSISLYTYFKDYTYNYFVFDEESPIRDYVYFRADTFSHSSPRLYELLYSPTGQY